jgi:hypothetical protein
MGRRLAGLRPGRRSRELFRNQFTETYRLEVSEPVPAVRTAVLRRRDLRWFEPDYRCLEWFADLESFNIALAQV